MEILSFANSKLAKECIYSFDLQPVTTCKEVGCKFAKEGCCYGTKGHYHANSNIAIRHRTLYALSKSAEFPEIMTSVIKARKFSDAPIRLLGVGEIYSNTLLKKFDQIVKMNPTVQFYSYTKALHLKHWPEMLKNPNYIRIQSVGGKYDHLIDWSEPHARVFENLSDMITEGYTNCSDSDLLALESTNIGLMKRRYGRQTKGQLQ